MFALVYADDLASAKLLRRHGARIDEVFDGETPLIYAMRHRRARFAKWLLSQGANPNFSDGRGLTALHHAVRRRLPDSDASTPGQARSRRSSSINRWRFGWSACNARAAIRSRSRSRLFGARVCRSTCLLCRRYGALWAYYTASSVTIKAPKGGLSKYSWNRKIRAYYRCKKCGCVTHYAYRKKRRNPTVAVNAVNFEPSALVGVRIRHLDGAASWKFLD